MKKSKSNFLKSITSAGEYLSKIEEEILKELNLHADKLILKKVSNKKGYVTVECHVRDCVEKHILLELTKYFGCHFTIKNDNYCNLIVEFLISLDKDRVSYLFEGVE